MLTGLIAPLVTGSKFHPVLTMSTDEQQVKKKRRIAMNLAPAGWWHSSVILVGVSLPVLGHL
eukprot:1161598-Pelagomonas_calceolata.AAC.8